MACDEGTKFTFQYLAGKKFNSIECKDTQELLLKWSMKNRIKAQSYSYDQQFQSYQKNEFVLAFMQDPNVIQTLQVLSSSGKWVMHGQKALSVNVEDVPCSEISMSYFDRLFNNEVVRESGNIVKCFDEFYDDITISDELRKMMLTEESDNFDLFNAKEKEEFLFQLFRHLCIGGAVCQYEDSVQPYLDVTKLIYKDLIRLFNNEVVRESGNIVKCFDEFYDDITISDELRKMMLTEESDNFDLFNAKEKEEFLFQLFRHLCIGGAVCQYEDSVQPYLDVTKLIYKDLISVQKDPESGKLHVTSYVFRITAKDEHGLIYPSTDGHIQDFAYIIVDPFKRHVNVLYHKFGTPSLEV